MASLFRVDKADDGAFTISTSSDGEPMVQIVFEHDMDGALSGKEQFALVKKFAELMKKSCYAHWKSLE